MDTLFGLPAHPFLVHVPIVLLPLAAVGVVVMAIKRAWYLRFRWAVLVIGGVGTLGAILAASAGEELESRIISVEGAAAESGWEHHAELGDTARGVAIVFFVLLAAYVLVPWFLERRSAASSDVETSTRAAPHWVLPVLAALAVVGGAASVTTVVQAGHSGSKSVWNEYVER